MKAWPRPVQGIVETPGLAKLNESLAQLSCRTNNVPASPHGTPKATVVTEDYGALFGEFVVCNPTGGPIKITLPRISEGTLGAVVTVLNGTAAYEEILVKPDSGSSTIDGMPFLRLWGKWRSAQFVVGGRNIWYLASTQQDEDHLAPGIDWGSATTVLVGAQPGEPANLVQSLDGRPRVFKGPQVWDVANPVGDLGLDTGTMGGDDWYHFYEVQSRLSDMLTAVASLTAPWAGGPTNYTAWRYLGAAYWGKAGWFQWQREGSWFYRNELELLAIGGMARNVLVDPGVIISVYPDVPTTADVIRVNMGVHKAAVAGNLLIMDLFILGMADLIGSTARFSRTMTGDDAWSRSHPGECEIPLPRSIGYPSIGFRVWRSGGAIVPAYWELTCNGWHDAYVNRCR